MSNRDLVKLGISFPVTATDATTAEATTEKTTADTNIVNATMSATAVTQVNPHHDVVDLSSPEGKKLCSKGTEGLPKDQKYDGDAQDIIKFVERVESKGTLAGTRWLTTLDLKI